MYKIILTQGIPASGKTSWAKKFVLESPLTRVRYNWDDLRNSMGKYWVPEREGLNFLQENRDFFMHYWMTKGWDIVVDNMNLNPKEIAYYQDLIEAHNSNEFTQFKYELELKKFFIPVEECIRRDSQRENPIGEEVIKRIWKRYRDQIWSEQNRHVYDVINHTQDLPHCILVDIDGTIALNLSNRPYYGEGCAESIHKDIPIFPTISIVETYKNEVIFFTGRDESLREETEKWIRNNIHIQDFKLVMRENFDYSVGSKCKVKLYNKYIKDKYNVDFFLEDSKEIADTFKDLGVYVLYPNL